MRLPIANGSNWLICTYISCPTLQQTFIKWSKKKMFYYFIISRLLLKQSALHGRYGSVEPTRANSNNLDNNRKTNWSTSCLAYKKTRFVNCHRFDALTSSEVAKMKKKKTCSFVVASLHLLARKGWNHS